MTTEEGRRGGEGGGFKKNCAQRPKGYWVVVGVVVVGAVAIAKAFADLGGMRNEAESSVGR